MASKYQERLEALKQKYGGGQPQASAPSPSPATNGGGIQAKMFQRLGIGAPGATAAPKTPAIPSAPPVAPDVQAFDESPSLVMDMPELPKYEAPKTRQLEQGPETNPYLSMTNDQLVKAGDTVVADAKVKRQQEAAQVWNKRREEKLAQLTANDDNLRFMLPELIADMEILPDDVRAIPAAKLPWDRLGQFDGLQQAALAGKADPEKGKALLLSVMESREQNPARQALRGFTHGAGEQLTLGLYEPTATSGSKVEGASEFAGSIVGQVPWSMAGGKVAQGLKVANPIGQGLITGGMMQTGREAITAAKDPEAYNVVEGLGRVLGNAAEYGAYTGVYSKLTPYMDAKVEQIAQASPNLGRVLQSIPGEAVQSVVRGGAAAVPVGFGKTVLKAFKDGGIDLNTAAKAIADEIGGEVKEEAMEYIALDLAFRLLGGKGPTPHAQGVTPSQTQTPAQTTAPVEQATPAPVQAPVEAKQEAPAPTPAVDEKTPPVASQTQEEASSPQGKSWTHQGLTYTVRNQKADGNWMVTVTDAQGKATPKTYSDKTVRAKLGLPEMAKPAKETAPEPEALQVDLEGAEVGKPVLSSEVKKGKPKTFGETVKVGDKVSIEGREGEFVVVDAKDPSMLKVRNANGAELPIGRAKVQPLSSQPANPTQSVEETPSTPKVETPQTPPIETPRNMQELRERSTAIQEPLKWGRPNQTTWTSGGYTITRLDAKDKAQKGNYQYAVTFNGELVGEPKTSLPDAKVVAQTHVQRARIAESTTPKGEVEEKPTPENPAFAGARPATPYVPAAPKPLTKVSRRQIVRELSKAFGPIRVGFASKIRGALGIFKSREQVIRTKMAEDFPVILHEVGHKLDAQMGLADPQFDAELIPLGTPTAPQGSAQPYLRGEGVGEFIRLYIMDEQAAQKAAPKFYPHFEAVLSAEPELAAQIQGARTLVKAWYAQNPHDKADGLISVDERGNKRPWSVEKMEAQLVEQLAPLRRATGELAEGRKLTVDEDAFSQALLARGWVGRAKTFLEYGVMDANFKRVGESMKDILHDVPDLDAFRRYIVFKRAQELMDKRKWSVEQTIGTGMTRAEIDQVVSDLKAVYEPLQKRLVKFQDAVLQELVDSGRLEPKEAQAMRQMNEEYVPFHRFFDEQSGMFNFIGANHLANVGNPLKEIKGSGRTVIDPMESIIKNTYSIINASQRNRVGRALLDLAQQAKNKGDVVEVVDENARDSNIVNVWKDGKKYRIKVDPELHRALLFLDREQTALWVKLVGLPARTLRAGAILNPDFMVSNPFVDQFTAYINSEYGYKPFWDLGKGLKSATTKDQKYWQWMAAGGAQANMVSLDRNYLQEELRGLIKSGKLTKGQVLHGINPLTYLRAASELGEIGTRLGEFGRGVERDSSREGILRSSLASRDLALDYAKTGSKTKTVNQISAFWNAGVQGLDKTRRQFVKYPVRTTARAVAAYTIPSIMLFLINKDNPWYEEKDEWMKDAFMMIPLDWSGGLATAQKSEHFLYLPRKHALALTFGALPERILRKWHKDDPKAFDMQFAARFVDNWTPDMPLPTAILPPIENWANKSFDTYLPLVPKREERLKPVDRYGPTTSEAAKGIARGLDEAGMGVSPRKVDNLVRGWGGGLGTMLTDAASWGMDKAGVGENVPKADKGAADYPVARRFLRDQGGPGPGSSVDEFYDAVEQMEQKYASMPDGPVKKSTLATMRPWRKAGDRMSELSARKREILAAPKLDGQEKRRLIDQIDLAMTNLARGMFGREPIK